MLLEIISPEKLLYKGEIALVQLPGQSGSFGVLKNHAPLVSLLESGRIKVIDNDRNMLFFEVSGGTVKIKDNHIVILADGAS